MKSRDNREIRIKGEKTENRGNVGIAENGVIKENKDNRECTKFRESLAELIK